MTELGSKDLQLLADALEGLLPFAWHVTIALGVIAHRMGQASLLLEIVVAPIAQLGHGVFGEEIGGAAKRGQLPQRRLGAILAKFKGVVVGRLGPRTRNAHKALRLVLPHQGFECGRCVPFLSEDLGNPLQRSPAAGGPIIFHGGAAFVQCGILFGHDPSCSSPATLEQLQRAVARRVPWRARSKIVLWPLSRRRASASRPPAHPRSQTGLSAPVHTGGCHILLLTYFGV